MRGYKGKTYASNMHPIPEDLAGADSKNRLEDESDEPTEDSSAVNIHPEDGVWDFSLEENIPLVLIRSASPSPSAVQRQRAPVERVLPEVAFDRLAQVPGYQGCMLIDSVSGGLLYVDGFELPDQDKFAESEATLWRTLNANAPFQHLDEVIVSTEEHIQISRSAEPTGQLFVIVFCSRESTNLAWIRMAFQASHQHGTPARQL